MFTKTLLMGAAASFAIASSVAAERGSDGNVSIIYWQAPSILNPFLSGGTKDVESASLIVEPLARYDQNGEMVPFLAVEIPTVENGGVSADLTSITWKIAPGIKWSDGTAFTAADVKFTADYCMHPEGGCAQLTKFDGVSSVLLAAKVQLSKRRSLRIVWVPRHLNVPPKTLVQSGLVRL